jgi:hypothetical protein
MFTKQKLILSFAVVLCAVAARADSTVYVVTSNQQFGTVNLATGAFQQIGSGTPEPDSNLMPGPNGTLYSLATLSGSLVTINPTTGATTVIGMTGLGAHAFDLAEVAGKLYLTDFSGNLYSVDALTGAAKLIGPTGIPADPAVPFTMNPDGTVNLCDESLYGVGGKLYATFDAFKWDPVAMAVTAVDVSPALYQIDPATGTTTVIGPTDLNLNGSVDVNGAFFAFNAGTGEVVTLDLANGQTGFLSDLDPAAGLVFGATPAVPEPTSLVLFGTGLAALATRLRRLHRRTI